MPANQILILSNRLPVHRVKQNGGDTWQTSPGGLVSALHPSLQATDSTWIGWTGSPCDAPEPFTLDGIRNTPVALNAAEGDLGLVEDQAALLATFFLDDDGEHVPSAKRPLDPAGRNGTKPMDSQSSSSA